MTILPGPADDGGYVALQKLTRRLPGACLFFHYSDDDIFLLALNEGGKRRAAVCTNPELGQSSRIPLISPALFGDDRATAALKLISQCTMLEEQLALAEEALGLSLLEHREAEPRSISAGTAAFDRISERIRSLKKRKNAYRVVLLADDGVPQWLKEDIQQPSIPRTPNRRSVPGHPELALCWQSMGPGRAQIRLISRKTGLPIHTVELEHEVFEHIWWVEELHRYAVFSRDTGWKRSCTLLDEELHITDWRDLGENGFLPGLLAHMKGTVLWTDSSDDTLQGYDLADGTLHTISLEVPAYFRDFSADGLIFASTGERDVLLFDPTGRLVSRHRFRGDSICLRIRDEQMFVVEEAFMKEEYCRVWGLDHC